MLLLILEIGLAIAAWRRGWKGWALLPLVLGYGAAFSLGFFSVETGMTDDTLFAICLGIDLVMIGTLIGMVVKRREKSYISETDKQLESGYESEEITTEFN